VNFFTTTSYNTSKYHPLLNIQHDAGRGAASGCGLVLLVRKALKARLLATTEYSCRPRSRAARPRAGACTAEPRQGNNGWLNILPPRQVNRLRENRYTWLPLLCLTPLVEGFPWDDLRKNFRGHQRMAKVPNAVEILPKITTAWVGRTSVTDGQTDRQTTDGPVTAYSEREREFTFTKNYQLYLDCQLVKR